MNMFFLIMLILSITPTEQLYAPGGDHSALDVFGDHNFDDPARPIQDPTHRTDRDAPLDPATETTAHRSADPKTVRQDPTQPKPQPISVIARDGGDTTVGETAKAKAVLARLNGRIVIVDGPHIATTIKQNKPLTLKELDEKIQVVTTEFSDVSFDKFTEDLAFSENPEKTLNSYSKQINIILENVKLIQRDIEKNINKKSDSSSSISDRENFSKLLQKCEDMSSDLEYTAANIRNTQKMVDRKLSKPPYDTLATLKTNMKTKFRAQDLTELTKLFNDSFKEDNPTIAAYLRADIANTLRTIKESNKNISKNERHSLELVLDDIKLVTGFLNSLNSGTFKNEAERTTALNNLTKILLDKAKKGYFGFAKERQNSEIKLVAALTAYVNPRNTAKATAAKTRDSNTTTQQLNDEGKAKQATKGTSTQSSTPAKARLKGMTTDNTTLLNGLR